MTDAAAAPAPKQLRPWWLEDASPLLTKARDEIASGATPLAVSPSVGAVSALTAPGDPALQATFSTVAAGNSTFVAACGDDQYAKDSLIMRGINLLAKWDRDVNTGEPPTADSLARGAFAFLSTQPGEEFAALWTAVVQGVQDFLSTARDPDVDDETVTAKDEAIAAAIRALQAPLNDVVAKLQAAAAPIAPALDVNKVVPEPPAAEADAEAAPAEAAAAPAEG